MSESAAQHFLSQVCEGIDRRHIDKLLSDDIFKILSAPFSDIQKDSLNESSVINIRLKALITLLLPFRFYFDSKCDEKSKSEERVVDGLKETVASFSDSAIVSLLSHTFNAAKTASSEFSKSTISQYSLITSMNAILDVSIQHPILSETFLLVAQCIYLLTRYFVFKESIKQQLISLVEEVVSLIPSFFLPSISTFEHYRYHSKTSRLACISQLLIMSLMNCFCIWKEKFSVPEGALLSLEEVVSINESGSKHLQQLLARLKQKYFSLPINNSLDSTHPSHLKSSLSSFPGNTLIPKPSSYAYPCSNCAVSHHGVSETCLGPFGEWILPDKVSSIVSSGQGGPTNHLWNMVTEATRSLSVRIIEGYVAMLELSLGMVFFSQKNDNGLDLVVTACFGSLYELPASKDKSLRKGKVFKRFSQLMPDFTLLLISPEELFYLPYEILSFLFDEMLPALKRIANIDMENFIRQVHQSSNSDRILPHQNQVNNIMSLNNNTGSLFRSDLTQIPDSSPPSFSCSSGFSYVLELLRDCLENLPISALFPDKDSDCATTFFIFQNGLSHIRQILEYQRNNSGVWENGTLKLVSRFFRVLVVFARCPPLTERVADIINETQIDCLDLRLSNLLQQAATCLSTELPPKLLNMMRTLVGDDSKFNNFFLTDPFSFHEGVRMSPNISLLRQYDSSQIPVNNSLIKSDFRLGVNNEKSLIDEPTSVRGLPENYSQYRQQQYVNELFSLLRQICTIRRLGDEGSAIFQDIRRRLVPIDVMLLFLIAPNMSQDLLGNILSLISALIASPSDVAYVLDFMDQYNLLSRDYLQNDKTSQSTYIPVMPSEKMVSQSQLGNTLNSELLSIPSHCDYERRTSTYSITIGFLFLISSLCQFEMVSEKHFSSLNRIVTFVASEIICGSQTRQFSQKEEKYMVMALSAMVLSQSIRVTCKSSDGKDQHIPVSAILATQKTPVDVLEDILKLISNLSNVSASNMTAYERVALYHCIYFIRTIMKSYQGSSLPNDLSFDVRIRYSTSFTTQLLVLAAQSISDTILCNQILQLLLVIPQITLIEASKWWAKQSNAVDRVISPLIYLLCPETVKFSPSLSPMKLDLLRVFSEKSSIPCDSADYLMYSKSLLLDLLIQNLYAGVYSFTAWFCGYPFFEVFCPTTHEEASPHGLDVGNMSSSTVVNACDSNQWLLPSYAMETIISGAYHPILRDSQSDLSVKYLQLLYLLRANPVTDTIGLREAMQGRWETNYLDELKQFGAKEARSAVCIHRCAYMLKILVLDLLTSNKKGLSENLFHWNSNIPVPQKKTRRIEDFSLHTLRLFLGSTDLFCQNIGAMPSGKNLITHNNLSFSASHLENDCKVAHWLELVLEQLPAFPALHVPGGSEAHLVLDDGTPQYSILSLSKILANYDDKNKIPSFLSNLTKNHGNYNREFSNSLDYHIHPASSSGSLESEKANELVQLLEKIQPFIEANQCLWLYSGAVRFVDGWCELIETSLLLNCDILSKEQITQLIFHIGKVLPLGDRLTIMAQEQLVKRLLRTVGNLVMSLVPLANPSSLLTSALSLKEKNLKDQHSALPTLDHVSSILQLFLKLLEVYGIRIPHSRSILYFPIILLLRSKNALFTFSYAISISSWLFPMLIEDVARPPEKQTQLLAMQCIALFNGASSTLCDIFCLSQTCNSIQPSFSPENTSLFLISFLENSFVAVDEMLLALFNGIETDEMHVTLHALALFDNLIICSKAHSYAVFHANSVDMCLHMKIWITAARYFLQCDSMTDESPSLPVSFGNLKSHHILVKELLTKVLTVVVEWLNTLVLCLKDNDDVVVNIRNFVRVHQTLLQCLIYTPTSSKSLKSVALKLTEQITQLFFSLSCTGFSQECRSLIDTFSIIPLLSSLTHCDPLSVTTFSPEASKLRKGGLSHQDISTTLNQGGYSSLVEYNKSKDLSRPKINSTFDSSSHLIAHDDDQVINLKFQLQFSRIVHHIALFLARFFVYPHFLNTTLPYKDDKTHICETPSMETDTFQCLQNCMENVLANIGILTEDLLQMANADINSLHMISDDVSEESMNLVTQSNGDIVTTNKDNSSWKFIFTIKWKQLELLIEVIHLFTLILHDAILWSRCYKLDTSLASWKQTMIRADQLLNGPAQELIFSNHIKIFDNNNENSHNHDNIIDSRNSNNNKIYNQVTQSETPNLPINDNKLSSQGSLLVNANLSALLSYDSHSLSNHTSDEDGHVEKGYERDGSLNIKNLRIILQRTQAAISDALRGCSEK